MAQGIKYATEEEKIQAQAEARKRYYDKNRDKIIQKQKERYASGYFDRWKTNVREMKKELEQLRIENKLLKQQVEILQK